MAATASTWWSKNKLVAGGIYCRLSQMWIVLYPSETGGWIVSSLETAYIVCFFGGRFIDLRHRCDIQSFKVLENTNFEFRQYSGGDVSAYVGQYEYDNESYRTELRIIPKKAGLFVVSLAALMIDENQRFAGKCNGIGSSAVMAHENPEQMNIEFLTESPDPHYSEWMLQRPQERFFDAGGYCFYVVE